MKPIVFITCHYFVKEIKRVVLACEALDKGNIEALGKEQFETHEGLSEDYLVSCDELDFIVNTLKIEKALIVYRLMDGVFGGCTINLIKKGKEEMIKTKLTQLYKEAFDIEL
jgi:galactokinase